MYPREWHTGMVGSLGHVVLSWLGVLVGWQRSYSLGHSHPFCLLIRLPERNGSWCFVSERTVSKRAAQNKTGSKLASEHCGAPSSSTPLSCWDISKVCWWCLYQQVRTEGDICYHLKYPAHFTNLVRISVLLMKLSKMYCFISSDIKLCYIDLDLVMWWECKGPVYYHTKETLGCEKSNVDVSLY